MKFKKLPLILACAGIFFVSCEKDELDQNEELKVVAQGEVSQDVMEKIASLHFNPEGAELSKLLMPDGTFEKSYLIEGDIAMTAEQMDQMSPKDVSSKQYRTSNLVATPKTVNVIGFTGSGGQGLTAKQRTALQWSIDNYNALNLRINFTLTFGTNYNAYDIVVYQNPNGQAGGVAGFPSGGNPYKYVQIYSGMEQYDTNTNEHVMTHELGHAVGLRHTDWFSRQSCGQSGESAGADGAVHIPGTPTGFDPNSIMLACFGSSEDGEFGYYDRVALDYLY
ncbi:M57 family metalloprotease [Gillisia limnaea]|uniref:Protease B n=1 Tax=Gillisia limnaea (strain DSM 15749 / LMG 21470 / R-8282) TaxID=865937 RepID=H2BS22_GILLR|nr:M57 family metalloprotease [Gillisia limnaea]EHQ03548.1 protease B [Gillisia limnaea DSM 15749]